MRIAIIHNSGAGEGDHTTDELVERFRDGASEVTIHGKEQRELAVALDAAPDLLVVAGGDGTVARAIRSIFALGHANRVPLLVFPLGTANNLARSLGITESRVEATDPLEGVRLDIGRIKASRGEELFVESVGLGPLGTILDGERSAALRLTRAVREAMRAKEQRFEKRVEDFAREVTRAEVMPLRLHADGEDLSGEYLLAEVMNIRTIGPLIPLAPTADPGDGMFDLLLVRESERDALEAHVKRAGGADDVDAVEPPGIRRRVREVTLSWPESGGHVDDRAWPEKAEWRAGTVRVTMAGAIEVRRPLQGHGPL